MTSRECVRECRSFEPGEDGKRQPQHYAACTDPGTCRGCVPAECRDGSLICDRCFGKARALLSDAPELLERLRSEHDAGRSRWNWDRGPVVHSNSAHPPAQIGDDLFDAIRAVEYAMWFYSGGIENLLGDEAAMSQLGPLVLDIHKPDERGVRDAWSILDALMRWGLERRETHRHVYPGKLPNAPLGSYAKFDEEEEAAPVTEYFEKPISVKEASVIAGVGAHEVRKWVRLGLFERKMSWREGRSRTTYLYPSEVRAVAAQRAAKRKREFTRAEIVE